MSKFIGCQVRSRDITLVLLVLFATQVLTSCERKHEEEAPYLTATPDQVGLYDSLTHYVTLNTNVRETLQWTAGGVMGQSLPEWLDYQASGMLVNGTGSLALRVNSGYCHAQSCWCPLVVYAEGAGSVWIDVSTMGGGRPE